MKFALVLFSVLIIRSNALFFNTAGLTGGTSTTSSSTPRVCVLRNCNLNSNVNVCGRTTSSNQCKRFRNSCLLRYEACVNNVAYTTVALTQCANIPVNTRRTCGSTTTTTTGTTGTNQAIVIRRRRRG